MYIHYRSASPAASRTNSADHAVETGVKRVPASGGLLNCFETVGGHAVYRTSGLGPETGDRVCFIHIEIYARARMMHHHTFYIYSCRLEAILHVWG